MEGSESYDTFFEVLFSEQDPPADIQNIREALQAVYLMSKQGECHLSMVINDYIELSDIVFKVKNANLLANRPTVHAMDIYLYMKNTSMKSGNLLKYLQGIHALRRKATVLSRTTHSPAMTEMADSMVVAPPGSGITSLSSSLLRIPSSSEQTAAKLFGEGGGFPAFPSAHTYRSTNVDFISVLGLQPVTFLY